MDKLPRLKLPTVEERDSSQTGGQRPERYLMDAANGRPVWVPADRMEQWEAAQKRGELSPGLRKYKQQIKDRILQEIYGSKK